MLYEFAESMSSPFVIPVAGCIMVLGIVAVAKASEYGTRKLQYEERMTAIAKGLPLPEPPEMRAEKRVMSMKQRNINIRLAGIICTGGAIAVALFFYMLFLIIGQREILSGAAAALVPLGIGAGLLIDAKINANAYEDEQTGR